MSFLSVKNLSKTYPGRNSPALNNVSFDLKKNQSLSVLGLNGHGKTTLLRLIAGHEKPDRGEIKLENTVMASPRSFLPPQKRPVTTMFQEPSLFPHLSVKNNILFGIHQLPSSKQKARLDPLVEMFGLAPMLDDYPGNISGGQRQKASLARTLIPHPQLALLDEPFSALDTHSRLSLREKIKQYLKDHHIASIYVLHQQEDALISSDLTLFLSRGRRVECAPLQKLFMEPKDQRTADFFGHYSKIPETLSGQSTKKESHKVFYINPKALLWEGEDHEAVVKQVIPSSENQKIVLFKNGHYFHGFAPFYRNFQRGQVVRFNLDPTHMISFNDNAPA